MVSRPELLQKLLTARASREMLFPGKQFLGSQSIFMVGRQGFRIRAERPRSVRKRSIREMAHKRFFKAAIAVTTGHK
jgi:hypothetical protein